MARCLAAVAIMANVLWSQSSSAKAMFYDPAEGQPTPAGELIKTAGHQLKAIKFARPFPQTGFVGIHYSRLVVRESDDSTPGEVGTYVVNR